MTNALKAQLLAATNAAIALVTAFGVNLSDRQTSAILGAVNIAAAFWITLTYKKSPKRTPDAAGP